MNLDRDDALRIRVGERIQQNVLDRAEDGGRRPCGDAASLTAC